MVVLGGPTCCSCIEEISAVSAQLWRHPVLLGAGLQCWVALQPSQGCQPEIRPESLELLNMIWPDDPTLLASPGMTQLLGGGMSTHCKITLPPRAACTIDGLQCQRTRGVQGYLMRSAEMRTSWRRCWATRRRVSSHGTAQRALACVCCLPVLAGFCSRRSPGSSLTNPQFFFLPSGPPTACGCTAGDEV